MSTTTVHAHHGLTATTAAVTALGLAAALALGAVVTERAMSDGSSGAPAQVVPAELPAPGVGRYGGPDALERAIIRRDALRTDPRFYGSPDAAERILSR